jgi:pimeloyl-ACP methyl ester carboxylesterase
VTTTAGPDSKHTFGESHFVTLDDGRRLHYRTRGTGFPTVVFESGMGLSGSIWGLVQPAIAERTTTVVYDRACAGLSDDDDAPRDLERTVADLAQLLRALPRGPLVLVGASWGGPIIRTVAASREFDIKGLVLVDQSDENAAEYFTPAGEKRMAQTEPFTVFLVRTGLYRLISRIGRKQPKDVYADFRKDFGIRGARMMGAEAREFLPSMLRLRDNPSPLEGIDVTVISGTKASFVDKNQRPALNVAHRRTAEALDKGRFVDAADSGHYVMFTEPDVVVDEIIRLLPSITDGTPTS